MSRKVHCLEGRSAWGARYFTCGRVGDANGKNHVGIADKHDAWARITCVHCQKAIERRYGLQLRAS